MTFKEDFKPSRVYNKLVIDAINKDIANDRSIIIPNTFDIDIKNNNKKYLCGTGRMECFDTGKIIKRYYQRPDDCCDYGVSCIRPDTGTCSMGNV